MKRLMVMLMMAALVALMVFATVADAQNRGRFFSIGKETQNCASGTNGNGSCQGLAANQTNAQAAGNDSNLAAANQNSGRNSIFDADQDT